MTGPSFRGACATLMAALLLTLVKIAGHTTASPPAASQFNEATPRTAAGTPDLQGVWKQIFQSPGYVVLLTEMVHDARIVPLDGRPHLSAHIRQWRGDSRGHWDGDTLVVETKNFRPEGTAHPLKAGGRLDAIGANLHLLERFKRLNVDTLNYDFTVTDSTTFARPWTGSYPMAKSRDQMYEYACHEGNYSIATILAGARAQETAGKARPRSGRAL